MTVPEAIDEGYYFDMMDKDCPSSGSTRRQEKEDLEKEEEEEEEDNEVNDDLLDILTVSLDNHIVDNT